MLGVVGLVIGGIWWAAAKMIEDYRVNKMVADLQLSVSNVQGLISFRDAALIDGGGIVYISDTILKAGGFPKDWVDGIEPLFGGNVGFSSHNGQRFRIGLEKIPRSFCVKIITRISSLSDKFWVERIQVNFPNWDTSTFPTTPEQAQTACTSAKNNRIYFYFPYTRINN